MKTPLTDLSLSTESVVYGPQKLANFRARASALLAKQHTQLVLCFIGDSWVRGAGWPTQDGVVRERYFMPSLSAALQQIYGDAGGGWCGLGDTVSLERRGGSANPNRLYQAGTGSWVTRRNNRPVPDLCTSVSSVPGDSIRITNTSRPTSEVKLFYIPGGSIEYRWDDGPWSALTLCGDTAPATMELAGFPLTGGWTLELRVVSGPVELAGIEHRNREAGIRIHNLGAGGSTALDWCVEDAPGWRETIRTLEPHTVMLLFGTNDQKRSSPEEHGQALRELIKSLRLALPTLDVALGTSPESGAETPPRPQRPMSLYRNEARGLAIELDACHIDLQPIFGVVDDYKYGGAAPLLDQSLIHPTDDGSRLISAHYQRLLDLR